MFSVPVDERITKLLMHEARAIDPVNGNVTLRNLKTGDILSIPYDSLIIAQGADPFVPPIKGAKENLGKGVYVLHEIESARKIMDHVSSAKKAVVVGAGPIGLEISAALRTKGLEIVVVEMLSCAMPRALDRDMAIRCGMDVYSLSRTEMAYCPRVAENYDVLNKAADFAIRKLEKSN